MCLLIVLSRVVPGAPLVVAANRDERLDRPARAMTVLRDGGPRVLGGVDELAGGTWLAVNDRGVVAGLTNLPAAGGRDPSRRSRGELPLALAACPDASTAAAVAWEFRPDDYNPCWLLVGDRRSLHYVDLTGTGPPAVTELGPGVHVLGNSPLGAPSPKVDHVRRLVDRVAGAGGPALFGALARVLADHTVTTPLGDPAPAWGAGPSHASGRAGGPALASAAPPGVPVRRPETSACCVHTDDYGTRSSLLVGVADDEHRPPVLSVADGSPCTADFVDATDLWVAGGASRAGSG